MKSFGAAAFGITAFVANPQPESALKVRNPFTLTRNWVLEAPKKVNGNGIGIGPERSLSGQEQGGTGQGVPEKPVNPGTVTLAALKRMVEKVPAGVATTE